MFNFHVMQERERKNLAILELIRKKGPISRAEISRTLGLNIVTVTNYIDVYVNKQIVLEAGYDVSSGGRRPELLELNGRSANIVGVDLGPETISAVVTNLKINAVAKTKIPRPDLPMESIMPEVVKVVEDALAKSKVGRASIKNIGVGVSGIIDYPEDTIRDTNPARGRTKVSFSKFTGELERRLGVPVYVGNDASCAAFGEKTFNPGSDVDSLIYLYSDVGCGMVIHGDVYIGSSGCAGETQLSFETSQTDDKAYVQEYAHLRPWGVDLGVIHEVKKAVDKGLSTEILNITGKDSITKEAVIEAARKKDKVALDAVKSAGRNLGIRVAYMVNLLNPAIIIIGGGMERAGDMLFDELKATVKRYAFEEPASAVKIVPSFLGDQAVALGAAALASREVYIEA